MVTHTATPTALLERDAELEGITRTLTHARNGDGGLLVIQGPAGVGKTALMGAARDAAAADGLLVLGARGAELERAFAFGIVRQLLDHAVRSATTPPAALFAGAARFAAPLLDVVIDGTPQAPSEDPFATRHALYWLVANLSAESPLALLVDDAQWADSPSLGALAHIANRLEGLPVALVVASRTGDTPAALDAIRAQADGLGALVRVGPLGEQAAAAVVRKFAPTADDSMCRLMHQETGGNPFLLRELARSVAARDHPSAPHEVLDQSPERVTREVAHRLARLPAPAAELARAAAVLGQDVPLRRAAALAGIDEGEAARAGEALVRADVMRTVEPLEFLHPLVYSAVYTGLGAGARATEHKRAARMLADDDAPVEVVAAQLLHCPPAEDPWTCEQLLSAAVAAATRGGAEAAARYLKRALDEPAPGAIRPTVLLQLGVAEAMSSGPEAAIVHLREALDSELPPEQRLLATTVQAALLAHLFRVGEAVDVIEEQLEALADRPDLQATAEALLVNAARTAPSTRPRSRATIERLRRRVTDTDERDPVVLAAIATEGIMGAEPADETAVLAERTLANFDWARMGPDWSEYIAARVLTFTGRYDAAAATLNQALDVARERGSVIDLGGGLAFRAELYFHVGELENAEIDARTLLEVGAGSGWRGGEGFAVACLGDVLIERGQLDELEELFEREREAPITGGYTTAEVLLTRARLERARGRLDDAIETLREVQRWSDGTDNVSPASSPWRSDLAHVLLDAGRPEEARPLADEELAHARRVGVPRALAMALRASARVEGGAEEVRLLREALTVVESSGAKLECAHVHAALGAALRRFGASVDEVREPLRAAIDLAHRCGASVLEDQALEELRSTGARPRRRLTAGAAGLTPSERRIAALAAAGQQNREIAQALYVTTHTVEFHLRNAYRKLGISGRGGLAGALGP